MANSEWRSQVVKKIEALVTDDRELARILFYLGQQDDACRGYQNSGVWKMLKDLLSSDRAFLAYLKRILEETNENRESVRDAMIEVYNQTCLKGNENGQPASKLDIKELTVCGSVGFARAWHCISPEAQAKILRALPFLVDSVTPVAVKNSISAVNAFGKKAYIALAAIYLSYEALHNIYRWWHEEISGKRVAKNIIDSIGTVGAGVGGGMGGAAVGGIFGPVGVVVGGVIGSVVSSVAASVLIDKLTQIIFDIPKDEALENAYNFLGVSRSSSNEDINKAYHSLCLKYHPDKGGSHEIFLKLQTYMGIIKVAKGEKY